MLHFAGGNCYSYQAFLEHLQAFHVVRLELPGRGKRSKEPFINDSQQAVKDILGQILKASDLSNYVIYGHSMGAILGHRVAGLLAQLLLAPRCLIVTGNPGPGIVEQKSTRLFDLPREAFIEEIRQLGGTAEALFQETEVFNYFEPILRADFQIVENGQMQPAPVLPLPIFAAMGDAEPLSDQIEAWAAYTTAEFQSKIFSGHHFFINDDPQGVCRFIHDAYDYSKSLSHG